MAIQSLMALSRIASRRRDAAATRTELPPAPAQEASPPTSHAPQPGAVTRQRIGTVNVYSVDGAAVWTNDLVLDADGAPNAYGPPGQPGLDYIENATTTPRIRLAQQKQTRWVGVVTDNGRKDGRPLLNSSGYYLSPTALVDRSFSRTDQRRYVNASTVNYIAIGQDVAAALGAQLGDLGYVFDTHTQRGAGVVFADIAPGSRMHEGSAALSVALGRSGNVRRGGGASGGILYVLFPHSGRGWLNPTYRADAETLFAQWGGQARLNMMLVGGGA